MHDGLLFNVRLHCFLRSTTLGQSSRLDEDPLHVVSIAERLESPNSVGLAVVLAREADHLEPRAETTGSVDLQALVVRLAPAEVVVLLAVLRRARRDRRHNARVRGILR